MLVFQILYVICLFSSFDFPFFYKQHPIQEEMNQVMYLTVILAVKAPHDNFLKERCGLPYLFLIHPFSNP